MSRSPRFPAMPPVRYASDREPWDDQNYIPTGPMRRPLDGTGSRPLPGNVPTQGSPAPGDATFVNDPWHPLTIVSSAVSPGVVTAPDPQPFLSAPNTRRNMLMFRNASTGGQNIYLEFGKVPTTDTVMLLVPGQLIYLDYGVSQDDLYAACDVAGGRLAYGYSTINNA